MLIPTTPDPKSERSPFKDKSATTYQKKIWEKVLPHLKLENMKLSDDPDTITEACDNLLDKLGRYDWRWNNLKNEINRQNHGLYKSLFTWM